MNRSESGTDTDAAVAALTEIQQLATKRRADAEALLAEARAMEQHVAQERDLLAGVTATAAAAQAAERDAQERVRAARDNYEAIAATRRGEIARYAGLRADEEAATAEVDRAEGSLRAAKQRLENATSARLAHPVPSTEPWPHETEARAGYEAASRFFEQCREARERADAGVAELQVRLELLSGTSGLNAAAVKPVAARRTADTLRNRTLAAIAAAAIIIVAGAIAVPRLPAFGVRVCDSSMTDRIVKEFVRTYSARQQLWPYHYTVTLPGNDACDVRFGAVLSGSDDAVIARDGVVAIVNPANPIARLDVDQLRAILTGQIVDWSQVGGPRGAIAAVVPADGSDEAGVLAAKVMLGHPYGAHDVRLPAGVQITRLIASPSGGRAIGIVPFSVAAPAKVLALGRAPPPSPLSIANDRYPLAVRLVAGSDFRSPRAPASALLAVAHSADANGLLGRAALITRNGP